MPRSPSPQTPSAADAIVEVPFRHEAAGRLPVETMSLGRLKTLAAAEHFRRHERMGFHLLVLYLAGRGRHEVDFEPQEVAAGTLVHVRPNQVHRWHMASGLQGRLLLVGDAFLPRFPLPPDLPPALVLPARVRARLLAAMDLVADEALPAAPRPHAAPILQHALLSVLHEVRREAERARPDAAAPDDRMVRLVARFQSAVDAGFHRRLPVAAYAERLGCSERNLARACLARRGCTPKALVDQRVLLESRRLLAHTPLSASQIGLRLGFSEATNFHKFFLRLAGETPAAFRARAAGPA